jgi:hypothetical protein
VLVASAGNSSGGSVGFPAALPEVIAVSASTITDGLASFSSVGDSVIDGFGDVSLIAPGANIFTTYKDGAYVHINGTSFSSPAVAGVAALVLAEDPTRTNIQVRAILEGTAETLTGLSAAQQGSGLVDAENAVLGTTTTGDNLPPAGPTPLNITTTSLPNGTVGQAYSATLAATGGATPYSWAKTGGTLPAGLTLSASGEISGTPTGAETQSFTVEVTDADLTTDTQNLSITVGTGGGSFSLSVSYSTEGGKDGLKHLLITFAASDGSNPVSGVTFSHTLSNTSGGSWGPVSGTTGAGGTTTFTLKNAPGNTTYSVTVHSATHSTLSWDSVSPTDTITK